MVTKAGSPMGDHASPCERATREVQQDQSSISSPAPTHRTRFSPPAGCHQKLCRNRIATAKAYATPATFTDIPVWQTPSSDAGCLGGTIRQTHTACVMACTVAAGRSKSGRIFASISKCALRLAECRYLRCFRELRPIARGKCRKIDPASAMCSMNDAARSLQLLRSKAAAWMIAVNRIGACGPSAGGCSSNI